MKRIFPGAPPKQHSLRIEGEELQAGEYNPPGLSQIAYRVGVYSTFLEGMRERLKTQQVYTASGQTEQPLAHLNVHDPGDLALALLKAWAIVGDVLTFYQERIANEGYLRTATEQQSAVSIIALVRTIGYEPSPGLAATTYLAFTLAATPGAPAMIVVPTGTAVMSTPVGGQQPQTFETVEAIQAHLAWNILAPFIQPSTVQQKLTPNATQLRLAGINTRLKPGDPVLLVGHVAEATNASATEIKRWFRIIKSITPNKGAGYTLVTLEQANEITGADDEEKETTISNSQLFAFRQQASLFGFNASDWKTVADNLKRQYGTVIGGTFFSHDTGQSWQSENAGLPAGIVRALVLGRDGSFFAGVAGSTVYRLAPGAPRWNSVSSGLTRNDVYSLTASALGHLFVGMSGGGVFRSTDNGDTWVAVSGGTSTTQPAKEGGLPVYARLPATVVRSLATYYPAPKSTATYPAPKRTATLLLAGTDNGVFRALDNFSGWQPVNRGLPNTDETTGLTSTVINTLVITGQGNQWYAGTDNGVYRWAYQIADLIELKWVSLNENLPVDSTGLTVAVLKLIAYTSKEASTINCLMAGTNSGIYLYRDDWGEWRQASNGLPTISIQGGATTPVPVTALDACTDTTGDVTTIFAGTSQGLYLSQDDGASWTLIESALFQKLFALSNPAEEIINALNQAEISDELRLQFQLNSFALSAGAVVTPAIEPDQKWQIFDSSLKRTYTLWIEEDDLNIYLTNADVCAVVADSSGSVIAATPLGGVAETEWPDFTVQSPRIDLDTMHKGILPDTYLALSQPASIAANSSNPPVASPAGDEAAPDVVVCKVMDSAISPLNAYSRFSTVTTIETDAEDALGTFNRRTTTVFLQSEQLALFEAQVQQPTFTSGDAITLDGLVQDFGPKRKIVVNGKRASAIISADLGGAIRLGNPECNPLGPANINVCALAVDSQNNLLAGTQQSGLLQYVEVLEEPKWVTLNPGATKRNVCALAVDSFSKNIYAAFVGGELFRAIYGLGSWTRIKLPVANDVRALAFTSQGQCFIGTDGGGIFRSNVDGSWQAVQTGLTNLHITSLAFNSAGQIFAGTKGGGVFVSADEGEHWKAINNGLDNLNISALVIGRTGRIYAGTHGAGVFVSADGGERWTTLNNGLPNKNIGALAAHPSSGNIYAGTRGNGVFQLTEPENHWKQLNTGVSNDVRALAVSPTGTAYAGTRKVALMASSESASFEELENALANFALPRKYQADFDLGIIPSAVQQIFETNNEALAKDASLTILQPGSLWLIASGEDDLYLIKNEANQLSVYLPNYALEIAAPPSTVVRDMTLGWQLLDVSGEAGFITARLGEINFAPALRSGQAVGEMAIASKSQPEPVKKCTVISLDDSLQNIYDAQTVQVYGNVASATHGETVYPSEVLGSGNAAQPHQRFVLKKPPLTYVPSTKPGLAESTLNVYVSTAIQEGTLRIEPGARTIIVPDERVAWQEVDTLFNADKNDHVYMVRTNEKGQTYVIFGDGVKGARLPSGRENVFASYRSGIGATGNLNAGQLTILKTRTAGLRSVTNPVPASGGIDPETMESARSLAPLTVRTMDRIVSLLDYEDFVRTMPGIGKVRVRALYYGNQPLAHITIAATDGSAVSKNSDYYRNLVNTIARYAASAQKFQVDSYEPFLFNLSAHVIFDKQQDQSTGKALIEATLSQTFSFAARDFGQDVEASEVMTLIQNIPGVVSVQLKALYVVGSSASLQSHLRAAAARFDPATQTIRPAQLLLINASHGIQLTLEPTP
jgi:ligand-binding sensor domain-containing protein